MSRGVYWLFVVSMAFQLAPVVAAVAVRRWLTRPEILVAACFLLMFLQDVVMWQLAQRDINNHWVFHAGAPIQTALLLAAFADWQATEIERLTLRFTLPVFLVVWVLLAVLFEDETTFSRFGAPLQAILLVAVSAWTLARRALLAPGPVATTEWFWISSGVLAYFATGALVNPISRMLLPSAPELVRTALQVRAAFNILVYLVVARGILCRKPLGTSGGFSLPQRSSLSSS